MCCFKILQVTVPIAGGGASVNKKVGTCDETPSGCHQKFSQISYFIGCPCTTCRTGFNHFQIPLFAWSVKFIVCQWRDDDARTDGVDGSTTFPPSSSLIHYF